MSFKFEKLVIWQNAMTFGEDINDLTDSFPKKEIYNLFLHKLEGQQIQLL